jgi:hypothetical protein
MSERLPVHQVGRCDEDDYRTEGLDCAEAESGFMEAYAEEGPSGVLVGLRVVALARLINQLAPAAGIEARRLHAALNGGPPLDDDGIRKVLEYFDVPVPEETAAAVG